MSSVAEFKPIFESALTGLLNNWRVWCGNDEIRAMNIGFDSGNTEVSVNLLTDREPYLEEQQLDAFGDRWPTADWRLTCINETFRHKFPDARELLEWMKRQSRELGDQERRAFNRQLKAMFFDVATGVKVRAELAKFRRVSCPFRVRVEWFFDNEPLDLTIT